MKILFFLVGIYGIYAILKCTGLLNIAIMLYKITKGFLRMIYNMLYLFFSNINKLNSFLVILSKDKNDKSKKTNNKYKKVVNIKNFKK